MAVSDVTRRLRELHEAATPGPWRQFPDAALGQDCMVFLDYEPEVVGQLVGAPEAALIAAARNALPALLDVAEAARKASPSITHNIATHLGDPADAPGCARCRLDAALARLAEVRP